MNERFSTCIDILLFLLIDFLSLYKATPHQGSYVADFLLQDIIGSQRVPALLQILEKLGLPGGGKAFDDLTTKKMEIFNRNNLNDPSVKYFSYGAKFQPSWGNAFRLSWGILNEKEGR